MHSNALFVTDLNPRNGFWNSGDDWSQVPVTAQPEASPRGGRLPASGR